MQPSPDISDKQEDDGIPVHVLDELGQVLRASFEATTEEPIPGEMALLLLRLALAQAVVTVAHEEALELCQTRPVDARVTNKRWYRSLRARFT